LTLISAYAHRRAEYFLVYLAVSDVCIWGKGTGLGGDSRQCCYRSVHL